MIETDTAVWLLFGSGLKSTRYREAVVTIVAVRERLIRHVCLIPYKVGNSRVS